jgi:hypothetical protein
MESVTVGGPGPEDGEKAGEYQAVRRTAGPPIVAVPVRVILQDLVDGRLDDHVSAERAEPVKAIKHPVTRASLP